MRLLLIGMTIVASAVVGGSAGPEPGRPVFAVAPTVAPTVAPAVSPSTASATVSICQPPSDGLSHLVGKAWPWVDPDPTGATVLWLPGLNARHCHPFVTHIDRAHAVRFAADVDAAQPWPPGEYSCPGDDEGAATVFLAYDGRVEAEVIQLRLAGCSTLTAPDRAVLASAGVDQLGRNPTAPDGRRAERRGEPGHSARRN